MQTHYDESMYTVNIKKPPALKKGDRVRLIAPASPFNHRRFERGVKIIRQLGFEPVYEKSVFRNSGFLAGDDYQRAEALEDALVEEDTQAVWCIRGGYGSTRLLSKVRLELIKRCPKILLGFSDVTALLLNLAAPGGFVTFHAPVVTQLPSLPKSSLNWLQKLVARPTEEQKIPLGKLRTVVKGKTKGFLQGGNLSILASLVGTPYMPSLAGAILFIEEVGEEAYRIDRLISQLLLSGALANVFGVVIGSLAGCKPEGQARYSARNILEQAVAQLGVPTVSGADFGHVSRNQALPLGVMAELDANSKTMIIKESVVT
jgi:muramoyltetrapeptide carboxypeptidase